MLEGESFLSVRSCVLWFLLMTSTLLCSALKTPPYLHRAATTTLHNDDIGPPDTTFRQFNFVFITPETPYGVRILKVSLLQSSRELLGFHVLLV